MREGRRSNAEEAVSRIRPDDIVILGHVEPTVLLQEIRRQSERLAGLRLIVWPFTAGSPYLEPAMLARFRVLALAGTHGLSRLIATGQVEYLPAHVSAVIARRLGPLTPTVVLLNLSEADAAQHHSFGIMADYAQAYVHPATRLVLAEANRWMPRTHGPNSVAATELDAIVATDVPVRWHSAHAARLDRSALMLAAHVAELVPDRATIQTGSTALADTILWGLSGKRDLGFHSGSMTRAALQMMEAGAITNRAKPINTGVSVTATLHGEEDFLRAAASRADIEVWPNAYTHDVATMSRIPRFISINSALQVDIAGQVGSEMAAGRIVGTPGGQGDFVRGAARSEGGFSIIALPATTSDGRISRITSPGDVGGLVTTPHMDVDFVVTEHGVAALRGRTLRQRMETMVRIAAPAFRDSLGEAAEQFVRRTRS